MAESRVANEDQGRSATGHHKTAKHGSPEQKISNNSRSSATAEYQVTSMSTQNEAILKKLLLLDIPRIILHRVLQCFNVLQDAPLIWGVLLPKSPSAWRFLARGKGKIRGPRRRRTLAVSQTKVALTSLGVDVALVYNLHQAGAGLPSMACGYLLCQRILAPNFHLTTLG